MYRFNLLSASLLLSLGACEGRGETTDTAATDDTGEAVDTDTSDTAGTVTGFTASGTAVDFASRMPAAEGLSISFADPQPALAGGDLEILASSTVGTDGAFSIAGIEGSPALGAFLVVTGGDNMPTATGVATSDYSALTDGDVLEGLTAYLVSTAFATGVNMSAAPLGYQGDVTTDGLLLVVVRDASGNGAIGATVTNSQGTPVYYVDQDPSDGLFTTGSTPNTSTDATGLVAVPAGVIDTYEATNGVQSGSQLGGTLPGLASFIGINLE